MNISEKRCIVSFANQNNVYVNRLSRLSESLRHNFDGDFIGFIGERSCGAEPHEDNPYNFKIHAIKKAIDAGYEKILWLDSSCFAIKNVSTVFDKINETGFIYQDSGHFLGQWTNDSVLEYFDITRDDAMEIKMIGNAGLLGLDISKDAPMQFFNEWELAMQNGCFKGKWNNNEKTESKDIRCLGSRHDMSCSSAIIHKMGLFNLAYNDNELLQYGGIYDEILNDTIIFKAQG